MTMRFVTFSRFLDYSRTCRSTGAALICCAALLAPALAGDRLEQAVPGKTAIAQPSGAKLPAIPAKPAAPALPASLTNVTTNRVNGDLVVSVLADTPVQQTRHYQLSDPPRLVVDLLNVFNNAPFFDLRINQLGVKKVRVRQFQSTEPKIVRLVFELDDVHGAHDVKAETDCVRIIFHPAGEPAVSKSTEPRGARTEIPPQTTLAPASQPPVQLARNVAAPAPAPSEAAAPKQPVAAPRAPSPVQTSAASPNVPRAIAAPVPKKNTAAAAAVRQGIPMKEASALDLSGSLLVASAEPATPPISTKPAALQAAAAATPRTGSSQFTGHPLTLDLIDISLVDFFRLMAEEGGINIVMDPEIKGSLSIKVVKVPWDQIFEAALANNGLDKQIEGNLVRIARKMTLQDEAKQREALKKANLLAADIETRIKRLNYAKAADLVGPLGEQKTVRGTVVVDERTNSLILTDIPSSLERMLQLVETLDSPQPQVEIEARIVAATRDFARDLGVQFGFVQGNLQRVTVGGPNTFGTIGGTRPAATPTNAFAAGNESTGRGASQSTSSQSAGVSTGLSNNNAGNFNVNLPAQKAFGGLGISVGNIFDTFLLDAAITAGETKGLAKLISQPKVTAQNNSPASITQGVRFPVQIIANNTVTVQFQNAALTLTVTPQITYEGNVVLDLKVENNTPDFAKSVNGIPSIRTSESSTRVLVTDGGTTVIGGILIDNETTQEDRVPGLASLPVIGNVFRRSLVSHSTQEVLFFITPRVIK